MLPKSDGPSSIKKIKLPAIQKDILQLAESHAIDNEETQTSQANEETIETTYSNDSLVFESYGSSLDLGYASVEGSLPQDIKTERDTSGPAEVDADNDLFEAVSFGTVDSVEAFDYGSILSQFDTFFRSKLDAELALFQESMHSMLTEQQVHLRKIITSSTQESAYEVETEDTSKKMVALTQESAEISLKECRCVFQETEKKTKNKVIIELLSLSCQLTQILGQHKFK